MGSEEHELYGLVRGLVAVRAGHDSIIAFLNFEIKSWLLAFH